jgi:hypothetical protein
LRWAHTPVKKSHSLSRNKINNPGKRSALALRATQEEEEEEEEEEGGKEEEEEKKKKKNKEKKKKTED